MQSKSFTVKIVTLIKFFERPVGEDVEIEGLHGAAFDTVSMRAWVEHCSVENSLCTSEVYCSMYQRSASTLEHVSRPGVLLYFILIITAKLYKSFVCRKISHNVGDELCQQCPTDAIKWAFFAIGGIQ